MRTYGLFAATIGTVPSQQEQRAEAACSSSIRWLYLVPQDGQLTIMGTSRDRGLEWAAPTLDSANLGPPPAPVKTTGYLPCFSGFEGFLRAVI
jgi:hypothetical protein